MSEPLVLGTTPDRGLFFEINTPDVRLGRMIHSTPRSADQIRPVKRPGFPESTNVRRFTGFAWGMKPLLTDFTNAIVTGSSPSGFLLNGLLLDLSGFNTPFGDNSVKQYFAWKNPGDLPGVSTPITLPPRAHPVFKRVVPAGETWNADLTADLTVNPKPTLPSQHVAMDRLLIGRQTYAPNQGYIFGFYAPPTSGSVNDSLHTFYFGGGTDITPGPSINAGRWCLTLRGSGEALLFEKQTLTWILRDEFKWSNEPRPRGGLTLIEVLPYGKDKIIFRSSAIASDITEGGRYFAAGTFRRNKSDFIAHLYQHSTPQAGHTHVHDVTGAGAIAADFRRDWRFEWFCGLQSYPTQADLYDEVIEIPIVPAGTKMRVISRNEQPPETSIEFEVYDADTHAPLSSSADAIGKYWISNAGQRFYYPRYRMNASPDLLRAPLLFDGMLVVDGFLNFTQPTPTSIRVLDASVTGHDYNSPDHESAVIEVYDDQNALLLLKDRARVQCRLSTDCLTYDIDTGEPLPTSSVLIDGEILNAVASPIPHATGASWPVADASRYNLTIGGKWTRIWDLELESSYPLFRTVTRPDTGGDTSSSWEPLTVFEIVTGLFYLAGFTENFVDLPEIPYRYQLTGTREKDILTSGTIIGEAILKFIGLYTDVLLFWDPNAMKDPNETMEGVWRGVYYPELPFHFVWNFTRFGPDSGNLIHVPESYPENTTFTEHYHEWVEPPEFNHLQMIGATDGADDGYKVTAEYKNRRSYKADQDQDEPDQHHPDYIGHEVLRKVFLPELTTQEATNYVGRRLFKETCFGYPRADFDAPLVLLEDPDDAYQIRPRPLRLGDMVQIDGRPAMIMNCNPSSRKGRGDLYQQAYYEVIYRDSFVGPIQVWEEPP